MQIISAGAGMGKTDTAFEYARQNKKKYPDGTFFFFLESKMTFSQSIRENLVSIGIQPSGNPSEDFIQLQAYVQCHPHCLFIYDNADDVSILESHLPASPLHILITTRRSFIHSPRLQHSHTLALQPLQPDTAIQLLLTLCHHHFTLGQLKQDCPSEYEDAHNVVGSNMLGGLPLGVVHAAALLNKQLAIAHKTDKLKALSEMLEKNRGHLSMEPRSIEEWLRNYRLSGILRKLENELNVGSLSDIRALTELTIWESSLTHQEKKVLCVARDDLIHRPPVGPWKMDIDSVCRLNEVCKPLLQAVGLLPSRDIPISLLRSYLSMICGAANDQQFDAAVCLMKEHSLLSLSEDEQSVTLHPLIQQTIQQCVIDKGNERQSVLSNLSATLIALLPSLEDIQTGHKLTAASVLKYSTHLYHIVGLCLDGHFESSEAQAALNLACQLSLQMHNMSVAESLCFGRLTFARRSGNKQHLLEAVVDAAKVCSQRHKTSAARALCSFALQLMSDNPLACNYTTQQWAQLMLNTAQAYWDLGCYAEVESVATKTKDVLEAAGLTKCYVFAECLSCLANCHNAKALYGAAEEAAKAALTVYSQCVSKYHPSVGTELANLGLYCIQQCRFEEAEGFLQKALDVDRNSLPAQHPNIVSSLRMMGYLYIEWGQYEEAIKYLTEAVETIQSAYLTWHAETAYVMSQLGRCYCNQGRLTESEECHRHALKVTKDLFGDYHHRTAKEYYRLGWCLYRQKKYADAQTAFHTALDIRSNSLGKGHPSTAWTLYHLSLCYQDSGNYHKALPLLQEAVKVMTAKYGDSHKDTVTMMTTLQSLRRKHDPAC
jgi:tetratricopeptide (TPR) repeat protein